MANIQPDALRTLLQGKRFLAADRAGLTLQEIASWDPHLLRHPRLLVPVDVQALFVAPGSTETFVHLPLQSGQSADAPQPMPPPFAPGSTRAAGVYLHWALPDALLQGRLDSSGQDRSNHLAMPPLPDRWLVLRLASVDGETQPRQMAWVLEADRAVAVPLAQWTEGSSASATAEPLGPTMARADFHGTAGGHLQWTAVLDATLNRMALHDPLAEFSAAELARVTGGCVSYLVAGWYSDPALDVLHSASSSTSFASLLRELGWQNPDDRSQTKDSQQKKSSQAQREALGLKSNTAAAAAAARQSAPQRSSEVHQTVAMQSVSPAVAQSVFLHDAAQSFQTDAWTVPASLLHGCIHGVPVTAAAARAAPDLRPDPDELSLALGQHEDDVLAAFAAAGATPEQERATEQLLTAFTAQKVNQLGSPDGLVALQEGEHGAAFASLPAGSEGTDRFLQRTQTGGAGGLNVGRTARNEAALKVAAGISHASGDAAHGAQGVASAGMLLGFAAKPVQVAQLKQRPELRAGHEARVNTNARSRVGDVLSATQERVVARPAPRWTFALDPLVAVRGARRSLRHGYDGRANANDTLSCRWPAQVPQCVEGLYAPARFVPGLGSGSIPDEALALARECFVLDPYHTGWVQQALNPPPEQHRQVQGRLQAEALLRYGSEGQYDGSTRAFASQDPDQKKAVDLHGPQERMGQALRRFSLVAGVEPSLVAVTAWQQPWVPLWLEWELVAEGVDPATLAAWRLGQIDANPSGAAVDGRSVILAGRSILTAGGADTLHSAISKWLDAENALDGNSNAGQVDEATEANYAVLAQAVGHLDVLTANLDGLRQRLLGLSWVDGLQRSPQGQATPRSAPAGLWAGRLRLSRLRLVDAFGRSVELPEAALAATRVPTRLRDPLQPAALLQPTRLLRPARWQFRWVEAATALGTEGTAARVDQVQPELGVNPVVGFLLPDHLDESLECFDTQGQPLGELLHEAASGAVMWDIAPLRQGPADAGPQYGLAPAQQAMGNFAAALVAADAQARNTPPATGAPPLTESALSALLRAVDTTLWTVDTFAGLGSEHVAGLVGRPIAVVRAQLRLELQPTDDIDLSDAGRAAEWDAMQHALLAQAFEVRIGELTRSDDGVLGFFVNDDFSRLRLVDKAIAANSLEGGRSRGQLGLLGSGSSNPPQSDITHPYIAGTDDADTLALHVGQTVTLTILMHPGGQCNLTSGVLPRKRLALARDWVAGGLAALAPSLRTGPVLVEADLDPQKQVRLPKVSVFGKNQNFLWRDTPASWRNDAILAATQTALLPDLPGELREGWIRVMPEAGDSTATPTPTTTGATP